MQRLLIPVDNTAVVVLQSAEKATLAIALLARAGFDADQLSVAAMHDPQSHVAYVKCGDHIRYYGKAAASWSDLWRCLEGWAVVLMPGVGPAVVGGPLANRIVGVLENSTLFADLSAIGAALYSMGVAKSSIPGYEVALKAGKVLLVAHGKCREVMRAKELLQDGATA